MDRRGERTIQRLEDIPNIGKAIAEDLRRIGIQEPEGLKGQDPFRLYEALNLLLGRRQDPCVLDVFIAAVRFMEGGPPRPWWHFTAERKRALQGDAVPAPRKRRG